MHLLFTQYLTFTYFAHATSSISANEDKSRFPQARCLRRRDLQIEFYTSGMQASERCSMKRDAFDRAQRLAGFRRLGWQRDGEEEGCKRGWSPNVLNARRSRFSFDIRGWFRATHPECRPTMGSLLSTGKRISLLNVNRLETIDAFTGLSDFPLCSNHAVRDLYSRPRARDINTIVTILLWFIFKLREQYKYALMKPPSSFPYSE